MNPSPTGGPSPVAILLSGAVGLMVLATGCTSTSGGAPTRVDWSRPADASPPVPRVVLVPAQPSQPASAGAWQPPEQPTRPAPVPDTSSPRQPSPQPSVSAPEHAPSTAPALPPAIIDDRHQPYRPPADREGFRVVPESRAQVLYTVRKGDTLASIARAHYGDEAAWTRIYEANRHVLKDASTIKPGMSLKMP